MSRARTSALGRSSYSHGSQTTTTKSSFERRRFSISFRAEDLPPPQDDWRATVTGSRSADETAATTDSTTGPNPSMSTSVGLSSQSRNFLGSGTGSSSGRWLGHYPEAPTVPRLRGLELALHIAGVRVRLRAAGRLPPRSWLESADLRLSRSPGTRSIVLFGAAQAMTTRGTDDPSAKTGLVLMRTPGAGLARADGRPPVVWRASRSVRRQSAAGKYRALEARWSRRARHARPCR